MFVLRRIFNDVSCQTANEYVSHWTTYFLGLFYYCFTSITQNAFDSPQRPGRNIQGRGARYIWRKTIRSYITKQIFSLDVSGNCFHFCQYRLRRYLDLMYYAARCVFTCVYGGRSMSLFFFFCLMSFSRQHLNLSENLDWYLMLWRLLMFEIFGFWNTDKTPAFHKALIESQVTKSWLSETVCLFCPQNAAKCHTDSTQTSNLWA